MERAARRCVWADAVSETGTALLVEAAGENMTLELARGDLAVGSSSVLVDWGDGERTRYAGFTNATHTYAEEGEYVVAISDDIAAFGYTRSAGPDGPRQMLLRLLSLGGKVTTIAGYCFNSCTRLSGVVDLSGVTSIWNYSLAGLHSATDLLIPSMSRIYGEQFYAGGGIPNVYADNLKSIAYDFFRYTGSITDLYIRSKTREEIMAMPDFPFRAKSTVRFHGSNGTVLANRTFVD